ncbi:hypothetical protein AVEN_17586-1 [Araneus ventricosus]|uniref:Uncharacterized protein n=1 Tax=Araneus ventricosus TaxID=182803 RepID=A0A4Y2JXN5_ARAVE|nr:hypothetical protein AVEN_17586-1 [Araneus ventricosus]
MNKLSPLTSFCNYRRSISLKQDGLVDPARWIGRGGPVAWPPRSPDLNPLDFFFSGHMKSVVYETPVHSAEDLLARIVVAADKINTPPGILGMYSGSPGWGGRRHFFRMLTTGKVTSPNPTGGTRIDPFERVRLSFLRRCELCNHTRGRHFEHLLRVFL